MKRVLNVDEILSDEVETLIQSENKSVPNRIIKISKVKLKEYKEALDEGLISQEEYDKAKKEFLNI